MALDLLSIDTADFSKLSTAELEELANYALELRGQERNVNQLKFYVPVSDKARQVHKCTATTIGVGGGNGSSKTTCAIADLIIRATGQIPLSLQADYPMSKFRGPINTRIVVESITTTLHPIILPKLMWWRWQGVDRPGGERGYYGLVPQHCLLKGDWSNSWSERTRTLQLQNYDPISGKKDGISTIQFMSFDQDPSDFASGDYHIVLHDEPPKLAIWVENMARTMRVNGTMMLAMTFPDDPTIPVDWILDRIYEPAQPGKGHDPSIAWFNLFTTENMNLNQTAVAETSRKMTAQEREARIYGQPMRLSNRVHPLFTDTPHVWCFECHNRTILNEEGVCGTCSSSSTVSYTHVGPTKIDPLYPVVCALDPHPRKPHMLIWVQITPDDDLHQVMELEVDGSPDVVAQKVLDLEADHGWKTIHRIMDPNMGRSPASADRETTWQDAFETAGLTFDLADDGEAGRQIVNDYLRPDPDTQASRILIDECNSNTIQQMKRYSWDDFKKSMEKDQKQKAKQKFDDYPTLWKYVCNSSPSFRTMKTMGHRISVASGRANGY
jgi:phage terminase large subunit-like protein